MIEIPLSLGFTTKVSDATYRRLNLGKWKWLALHSKVTGRTYAFRRKAGKILLLHRLIAGAKHGQMIDHRNRDTLDNQVENLRLATPGQNSANSRKPKLNTSGFKGVSWAKNPRRWMAQIVVAEVKHYLGLYSTQQRAALAYDRAAVFFHGEFAGLNFPNRTHKRLKPGSMGCAPNCLTHVPKPTSDEVRGRRLAYIQAWNKKHPEKRKDAQRKSYLKHRAARLAYQAARRLGGKATL